MKNKITTVQLQDKELTKDYLCKLSFYGDYATGPAQDYSWAVGETLTKTSSLYYTLPTLTFPVFDKQLNINEVFFNDDFFNALDDAEDKTKYFMESVTFTIPNIVSKAMGVAANSATGAGMQIIVPGGIDSNIAVTTNVANSIKTITITCSNMRMWKYSSDANGTITKVANSNIAMEIILSSASNTVTTNLTNNSAAALTIKTAYSATTGLQSSEIFLFMNIRKQLRKGDDYPPVSTTMSISGLNNRLMGLFVPPSNKTIADQEDNGVYSGVIEGVLVADSPHFYNLEPGAMYLLSTNCHLKHNGAYRGSCSYIIAAHGGQGATTTAQGVGHAVAIGNMGTTGLVLQNSAYPYKVNGNGTTYYASRIGIGSCTTQCRVKYSLTKIMGSDEDFEMDLMEMN